MHFLFKRTSGEDRRQSDTQNAVLLAFIAGICLILLGLYLDKGADPRTVLLEALKEFGIVLASVFGVSFFYERFIAERHFRTFHTNLQRLIGRGESNAAICEALGILQIFRSRKEFEAQHSLSEALNRLGKDDYLRITGRSLIFTIYAWQSFKTMLAGGAKLELCMVDPWLGPSPLTELAGYSELESRFAIQRLVDSFVPWLQNDKPSGCVEIRFHTFPLLDSLSEIKDGSEYRMAWDTNFGEGLERRYIFFLDGNEPLGRSLRSDRYDRIWRLAKPVFVYSSCSVSLDGLADQKGASGRSNGPPPAPTSTAEASRPHSPTGSASS